MDMNDQMGADTGATEGTGELPSWLEPLLSRAATRHYDGGEDGMGMGMGMGGMGMGGMGGSGADMQDGPMEISARQLGPMRDATVALSFSLDWLPGEKALITRDLRSTQAGDLEVFVRDGVLVVTLEDGDGNQEWLKVPDLVLMPQTEYHLAVSLGRDGLMVWLNGRLVAAEPEAKTGWNANTNDLLIGGSRAWRDNPGDDPHSLFEGEIGNVHVFDKQLNQKAVEALARAASPDLGAKGAMAEAMADLIPGFTQLHHGSDTARMMAMEYGIMPMAMPQNGDVPQTRIMRDLAMEQGGGDKDRLKGGKGDDALDGQGGNDRIAGKGGHDIVQGGTGNDRIAGNGGRDILDGGEGEDILKGGGGDDLLISRADAREPDIARVPGRDEGDPLNELTNGKLYPDQIIPGDDLLIGGGGADIFYFQTLINAKQRYIEKHTNDDGVVNWHGVAGENDKLHDHWVDHIGYDVVADYDRSEGDRIVIEGHTTKILKIEYGDGNGDGVMDFSEIFLYSDQGAGGGAHNQDRLGSITVYGDLVLRSDIETTSAPAYGIVKHVGDLDDAVTPPDQAPDRGKIKISNKALDKLADGAPGPVDDEAPRLAVPGTFDFNPESRDALVFDHAPALALDEGTIAFSFTKHDSRWMALFSKDAEGQDVPGHVAAYVEDDGDLVVRLQDKTDNHYLVARGAIAVGTEYDVAVSWGADGATLWLDGVRVAYRSDLRIDLAQNAEPVVVGATGWSSTPGTADEIGGYFDGEIGDFAIYAGQIDPAKLGHGGEGTLAFDRAAGDYRFDMDGDRLTVSRGDETVTVTPDTQFLAFADRTVRPKDIVLGGGAGETLEGGEGVDIFLGRGGDDKLVGWGNDDLLDGGDGNDQIWGGDGADLILGEDGDDRLEGGGDGDDLRGGFGDDTLVGSDGNDTFRGGFGDDEFWGHSWGEAGRDRDTVVFDGSMADYTFEVETFENSTRGTTVTRYIVTDHPGGGTDGFYEGEDRLVDIERIVFADQTVEIGDLPV